MNIPLSIIIGLLGVFIGGWLQKRHWLRATKEEIRVRETADANALVKQITKTFDERMWAQRNFLNQIGREGEALALNRYREAIRIYTEEFNSIRTGLFFYFSYKKVLSFEKDLHNRLVANGALIESIYRDKNDNADVRSEVAEQLSTVSAKVFRFCKNTSDEISTENFGTMRKINDWKRPDNQFVGSFSLIRRIFNL